MYQGLSQDIAAVMREAIASGIFVSLCTIQQPSGAFSPSGQPDGNYSDVIGLVNLPCMMAPESGIESKTPEQILAYDVRHVLLDGLYRGIQTGWRAVIDGEDFDVLSVDIDSQSQMTRMQVRIVTI